MFREPLCVIRGKQSPQKRLRRRVRSSTPRRLAPQQCNGSVVAPATLQRFSRSLVNLKMQQFPRWWVHHDVDGLGEGLKRIRHARLGEIEFGHDALLVANAPDLRLIIYMPAAGEAAKGAPALG